MPLCLQCSSHMRTHLLTPPPPPPPSLCLSLSVCVAVLVAAVDVVAGMAGAAQVAGRASQAIFCLCSSFECDHWNHNAACLAAANAPKGTFPPSLLLLPFSRCISSSVPFSSCAPFSRCVCFAGLVRVAGQRRGQGLKYRLFPWVELGYGA